MFLAPHPNESINARVAKQRYVGTAVAPPTLREVEQDRRLDVGMDRMMDAVLGPAAVVSLDPAEANYSASRQGQPEPCPCCGNFHD